MEKQTLRFPSLEGLCSFAKSLDVGYFINTNTLTITGRFAPSPVQQAVGFYGASLIETTEKVYSYDPQ